jgi:putative NADH-flavin reductase
LPAAEYHAPMARIINKRKVHSMRLTIFGATGKTGSCLVTHALTAGHEVTAVVRDPKRLNLPPNEHLRVVTADVMDPANIVPAVADADVVVSALGPPSKGPTTVLQDSTRSIIEAMEKSRTRRLVTTVSGSMVDDSGDGAFMHYLAKPMTRRILKNVCSDMRRAESEIHASGLDWTIFRPPRLTDKPGTGRYRMAIDRNVKRGLTISRADLAKAVFDLLDDPATVRKHVFVAH